MDVKLNLTFNLITAIISIAIIEFGAGSISEIVVPSNTKMVSVPKVRHCKP